MILTSIKTIVDNNIQWPKLIVSFVKTMNNLLLSSENWLNLVEKRQIKAKKTSKLVHKHLIVAVAEAFYVNFHYHLCFSYKRDRSQPQKCELWITRALSVFLCFCLSSRIWNRCKSDFKEALVRCSTKLRPSSRATSEFTALASCKWVYESLCFWVGQTMLVRDRMK